MAPTDSAVHGQPPFQVRPRVVNDFSIQVATVNGSGSQTANLVLLRSLLLMGIPASGKNMFPSNIAGLPTWYTIRASRRGYVGRKKEVDFLVAMNPETAPRGCAVAGARHGGRLRPAAEAERASPGPDLLPRPLRQTGRTGLSRREAATAGAEHDLRRHPGETAGYRSRSDGSGAEQAAREGRRRRSRSTRPRSRPGGSTPSRSSPNRIHSGSSEWTRRRGRS